MPGRAASVMSRSEAQHGWTGRALRAAFLVWVAAALSGCAARPKALVEPGSQAYEVRPGDRLEITVWPDNEMGLSGQYVVEDDGRVYLPLLGGTTVGGLETAEVRSLLRLKYEESIKEPVVSVIPTFPVSVIGAVVRPGIYMVTPSQSLYEVISLAGGFAPAAKQSGVQILRGGRIIELNATRLLDNSADIALRSGDRIRAPPRRFQIGFRDVLFVLQSVGLIITLTDRLRN